jgi:hypothetical protein
MSTASKFLFTAILIVLLICGGIGMAKAFSGNFFANASFISSAFLIIAFLVLVYLFIRGIKFIWLSSIIILLMFTVQSCNYAKSNQQVLISTDCGMSWKKVSAGDAVPKGTFNQCYMKVVIPNYPMQGESKFISNLSERVKVNVEIDYDYSITDGLAFIKEAKYLGKANKDADSDEALNSSAFESAENRVIEKRIREVAKGMFLTEDIVELDQAELEDKLMDESNKMLDKYGVKLNFITLTFVPDEQTKEAIDVATAMRIYESKGLKELGEKIMAQRAGATKISVENKTESQQSKD